MILHTCSQQLKVSANFWREARKSKFQESKYIENAAHCIVEVTFGDKVRVRLINIFTDKYMLYTDYTHEASLFEWIHHRSSKVWTSSFADFNFIVWQDEMQFSDSCLKMLHSKLRRWRQTGKKHNCNCSIFKLLWQSKQRQDKTQGYDAQINNVK